jgi:hypothetical protein
MDQKFMYRMNDIPPTWAPITKAIMMVIMASNCLADSSIY